MEYFEIFGIAPAFVIDEAELKKHFYANSKRFHPDFHTSADVEKQVEILAKSSLNNKAYKVLKEEYSRIGYILEELDMIGEGKKNDLPQEFLMEMMDVNEELMELQFDPVPEKIAAAKAKVNEEITALKEAIDKDLLLDPKADNSAEGLSRIKDYYFKRKYMLRMLENLDRFAGLKEEQDPFE